MQFHLPINEYPGCIPGGSCFGTRAPGIQFFTIMLTGSRVIRSDHSGGELLWKNLGSYLGTWDMSDM